MARQQHSLVHEVPCPAGNDVVDRVHANAVIPSQRRYRYTGGVFGSNLPDLTDCQFARVRRYPRPRPVLQPHVSLVIGVVAQEQVVRIHASTVVAPVQNVQAVWYPSVRQLPRYPVCQLLTAIDTNLAVPAVHCATPPFPAPVDSTVHALPEPSFDGLGDRGLCTACSTAITATAAFDLMGVRREPTATRKTRTLNAHSDLHRGAVPPDAPTSRGVLFAQIVRHLVVEVA